MSNTARATLKFAAAMATLMAVPVYAQSQGMKEPGDQETITVRPPYVVTKTTEGAFQNKRTSYTISRVVDYGDLDLKSDAGVSSLNGRVQEAANGVCHEIDNRFPDRIYMPVMKGDCTTNAMAQARPQVIGAIKRARG